MSEDEYSSSDSREEEASGKIPVMSKDRRVVWQLEYYFGDLNLYRDKFLCKQLMLNTDGWVPLKIFLRFNRLGKLTTDVEFIVNTVKTSGSSLLQISEDNQKIRRNPKLPINPLTPKRREELRHRTVYAKGFPLTTSFDELLYLFDDIGRVESINMRYYFNRAEKKRFFKGSVFITFKSIETARTCIISNYYYKGGNVNIIWLDSYLNKKKKAFEKHNTPNDMKQVNLPKGSVLYFTKTPDRTTREQITSALTALGGNVGYITYKMGDPHGWVRLNVENSATTLFNQLENGVLVVDDNEILFRVLEGEEERTQLQLSAMSIIRKQSSIFGDHREFWLGNREISRKRNSDDDVDDDEVDDDDVDYDDDDLDYDDDDANFDDDNIDDDDEEYDEEPVKKRALWQ